MNVNVSLCDCKRRMQHQHNTRIRTHLHSNNITHYNINHCCNACMWVGRHFLEISHDNSCTQTWIISCISNALRISGIVVTVVVDVVHHRKIKFSHRSNSGHTHTSGLESMRLVNRYIYRDWSLEYSIAMVCRATVLYVKWSWAT